MNMAILQNREFAAERDTVTIVVDQVPKVFKKFVKVQTHEIHTLKVVVLQHSVKYHRVSYSYLFHADRNGTKT